MYILGKADDFLAGRHTFFLFFLVACGFLSQSASMGSNSLIGFMFGCIAEVDKRMEGGCTMRTQREGRVDTYVYVGACVCKVRGGVESGRTTRENEGEKWVGI